MGKEWNIQFKVLEILVILTKKKRKEIGFCPIIYKEINSTWIKSLKIEGKSRKCLKHSIGEYLHNLEVMKQARYKDKD